jgi:hypothetical protein
LLFEITLRCLFYFIRFSVSFYTTRVRLLLCDLAILFEWVLNKFDVNKICFGQIYVRAAVLYRKPRKLYFVRISIKSGIESKKVLLKGLLVAWVVKNYSSL